MHRLAKTPATPFCMGVLCACLGWAYGARGDESGPGKQPSVEAVRAALPKVLRQVDSGDYAVRRRAGQTVEGWLDRPELSRLLAEEFARRLLDPQMSFEVRHQMERWARRLPRVELSAAGGTSVEEIDRLVRLVDDDSFAVREGAKRRIAWWLDQPALAGAVYVRLKRQSAAAGLRPEQRAQLEPLVDAARGAWLRHDPDGRQTPPLSDAELERRLAQLEQASPEPPGVVWPVHAEAERELLDALARDDQVPRIKALVERRIAAEKDPDAVRRLRAVLDWTRPELVAEFWEDRRHKSEQHLLVGVPTRAEGAPAPSHFDRIDDRTAHCVTGATLSQGDYPAMEAFPHPLRQTAFFHLMNLSTPHRRLAYAYAARRDDAVRLAEISRRTLDRWLERKHPAKFSECVMLGHLDPKELSRFAGRYFLLVDDARLSTDEDVGDHSVARHAIICSFLIFEGTRDAIPDLLTALQRDRFLPPSVRPPYRAAWCAALAIARRDPWPDVDAWLAGLLGRQEELVVGGVDGPQLWATAAALLLERHDQEPETLGLESTGPLCGRQSGVTGYRGSKEAAQRIEAWWKKLPAESIKRGARD